VIHVACQNCGAWDIVGPGHPAVRPNPETQQHELFDRNAVRHTHAEDCQPDEDGNYPLHFTFMAGTATAEMV
jgi:hypothetical protein